MINFNGKLNSKKELKLTYRNRAFKYGDAIFDTLKYNSGSISFLEDHYFRLMSSMRMLRMKIPMNLSLTYYKDEIKKTVDANGLSNSARIRVTVFRKDGGMYTPLNNGIDFLIEVEELKFTETEPYEIELFKDFYVQTGILSNIKTNNRMINVLASVFADECGFQNCILINENKNIVEATNSNIFLIKGSDVYTPALEEGCINGIVRKKIIEMLENNKSYKIHQTTISPFELLKSDEVFLTNSITEFKSVTCYRKKTYANIKTLELKNLFQSFYKQDYGA